MALISDLGNQWVFGTEMSLSSNGERIAICGYKAPTSIVETKTRKVLHTLFQNDRGRCGVVFTADDKSVVSASGSGLQIWDVATGNLVNSVIRDDLGFAEISPDGSLVATGNYEGRISILRVADGTIVTRIKQESFLQSMAISSDDKHLITVGWDTQYAKGDYSTVNVWNMKNREIENTVTFEHIEIQSISASRIGNGFAVGEQSCFGTSGSPFGKPCAYFWQSVADKTPTTLRVPSGVTSIIFSPIDNKIFVSAYGGIYIWQKP